MKSAVRRIASKMLDGTVRHSPPDSQCWGRAMLRELDFVEGDWAALSWAFGSIAAIFKTSVRSRVRDCAEKILVRRQKGTLRIVGAKAAGIVSGVVICCGVLAACVLGFSRFLSFLFPESHLERAAWAQWMSVLGMPELIFVAAAAALWRKRRTVAAGILLGGVTLLAHVIMYVSAHG